MGVARQDGQLRLRTFPNTVNSLKSVARRKKATASLTVDYG